MGIFIIIIAVLFEITFMVYCIRTKENHTKTRSWVMIAAFVAFVSGTLTSVLDWGFRWYFLGGVLAIFALIGAYTLLTRKFGKNPYRTWRIVCKMIRMVLIITLATMPAIVFPQYENPRTTGRFAVDTATYTFTDESRIETFVNTGEQRKVTVEFWYPRQAEGIYPLIVFSHGAFGVRMSNTSTFMDLASNGYVVCSIDHPYHAAGTIDADKNLTLGSKAFMQEVIDANGNIFSEREQFELYTKWMDLRTGDIAFVLDTIQNTNEGFYTLIDRKKTGLIGHSLGGSAAAQLGRVRDDIGAVINLDGSMLGEYRLNKDNEIGINEEPYPLPLLNFYSEYVINELQADPAYVYPNKYVSSISAKAFEVCIKGTNHMSYTDLPLFSPFLAKQLSGVSGGATKATVDKYYCIETMNTLVLEFFNCYLKGEGSFTAKEYY